MSVVRPVDESGAPVTPEQRKATQERLMKERAAEVIRQADIARATTTTPAASNTTFVGTTKVKNPIEGDLYRNKVVENHTAFSKTIDNSTGREYYNETHKSGSGKTYTNVATIELNTNNKQELTKNDSYKTIEGGDYSIAQEKETRVFGDFTILTGSPNLYNTTVMSDWMEEYSEIAAAKSQFEQNRGGFTNNSESDLPMEGSTDPDSGSTAGQSFPENQGQKNLQDLLVNKQEALTKYERAMGVGGSIKLLAAKDILIKAGTVTSSFDSAAIDPSGRKVAKQLEYDGDKTVKMTYTSATYVEEKDTASNVPFGNVVIEAGNSITFKTGAGGVSFTGAGKTQIGGTGSTIIGGAQVLIGGSAKGGAAGSVLIRGANSLELESPNINLTGSTKIHITPGLSVQGDQVNFGDVIIGGNLTVLGNIKCTGTIFADGNIESKADVIAGDISLKNHQHDIKSEAEGTGGLTGYPRS